MDRHVSPDPRKPRPGVAYTIVGTGSRSVRPAASLVAGLPESALGCWGVIKMTLRFELGTVGSYNTMRASLRRHLIGSLTSAAKVCDQQNEALSRSADGRPKPERTMKHAAFNPSLPLQADGTSADLRHDYQTR
jgi:hypothetical protein